MEKLEFQNDRALEYIAHLVLVRSMLKNCNFPSMNPDEERIFKNIAIDCCLEIKIADIDLIFLLSDMSQSLIQQGLKSLKDKGFIDFEKPEKAIRYIKLTKLASEYLSNMGSCIFHASPQLFK